MTRGGGSDVTRAAMTWKEPIVVLLLALSAAAGGPLTEPSPLQCGLRYAEYSSTSTGITGTREDDPSSLAAPTQAFPWLVKVVVVSPILNILCAGVIASSSVVIAPAHCLRGIPAETIRILVGQEKTDLSSIHDVAYHIENVILHPDHNSSRNDHVADVAVVKLAPRRDVGPIQWSNYSTPLCLAERSTTQERNCQVAGWAVTTLGQGSLRSTVVAHTIKFQAESTCLKNSLQATSTNLLASPDRILCSTTRCNRFVTGPVLCAGPADGHFYLAALPTDSDQWCNVGAYTRVSLYHAWLQKTIAYLDTDYVSLESDTVVDNGEISEAEKFAASEENSCSSSPCGSHASCWTGQGRSFLCTCDADYPKGNPYQKCVRCVYDNHCPSGQTCQNEECKGRKAEVPKEFVSVGANYYLISEEQLPWLQAQYDCMNRQGHLVELVSPNKTMELQEYLMSRFVNRSFWVGASDLETEGTFRWFYSGDQFGSDLWKDGQPAAGKSDTGKKEHCVQLNPDFLKFSDWSCDNPGHYICEYMPEIYLPAGDNGVTAAEGRARSFDTLNPDSPYSQICGRKFVRNGRIVGGGVANYAEWPWQVSLRQYKNGQFKHKCGAALITNTWIVTAAHCVKDISPSNLMVRVGEYHVLNRNEAHPHLDRRIRKVVTHKHFDKFTYEYDIALLEMHDAPIQFQPNIIPICLPESDNNLVGQTGWVTGWGRLSEFGQISPVLREVSLPIISNSQCMKMYRNSGQNEWIPKIFLCAGTQTGGQDSCEGDSGGPLVVQGKDGRWQLAGIISWGIGCGDRDRPGVYTRISEFRSWISNAIDS